MKQKIKALWVIVAVVAIGIFLIKGDSEFRLGLDLAGGSALTYLIHTEQLPAGEDVDDAVNRLRDLIERRVNPNGVSEATVVTSYSNLSSTHKLVVELPGITDIEQAKAVIKATPVLDFRVQKPGVDQSSSTLTFVDAYQQTPLTGRYLDNATVAFDQSTGRPMVELTFNDAGADMFAALTKANIGKQIAIFLDGSPISAPTVQQEITGGKAVISGSFSVQEAKELALRLKNGALPVPITEESSSIISPTLGTSAVATGVKAGLIGFLLVAIFMIVWYRLPGVMATLALVAYSAIMLAIFKNPLFPVTLTSAGIAGFIISIGLAVDANVLTFERMKEEIRNGKNLIDAIEIGFLRAWTSIRDSHIAAIIVSVVLYMMGTSVVKGFAIAFFLGAVVSLISAQLITRVFMRAIATKSTSRLVKFLFSSGFHTK
jgi:protein-export membrane protein SecD